MIQRTVHPYLQEYLSEKLVLLSGPRQVGKTVLSKSLNKNYQYFNYDESQSRLELLKKSWVRNGGLLIFDEIHKMPKWKSWLKGIYDIEKGRNEILVTGSARMDTFKKAGDSLAGRHFSLRLLPFSLREVQPSSPQKAFEEMLRRGSFPEPFLSGSDRKAALWRKAHLDVILRQDISDQESIKDINSLELLVELLSERAGQGISYRNLADDLSTSPHTVKRWIQLLESYYIIFQVFPYTKNVSEAVKKEPRIFFYDIGRLRCDEGFKIENLVALHLLKMNWFLEDTQGVKTRLCYLRDKKKREVDFAVVQDSKLTHLLEIKKSDASFNSNLNFFSKRLKPLESLHLVLDHKKDEDFENYKVRSLCDFLLDLPT